MPADYILVHRDRVEVRLQGLAGASVQLEMREVAIRRAWSLFLAPKAMDATRAVAAEAPSVTSLRSVMRASGRFVTA